jgi:hypothetical protein
VLEQIEFANFPLRKIGNFLQISKSDPFYFDWFFSMKSVGYFFNIKMSAVSVNKRSYSQCIDSVFSFFHDLKSSLYTIGISFWLQNR